MSANYRNPQWLLPNCKNLKLPGTGTSVGSGLTEDRHSLYSMDFDGTAYIDAGAATVLTQTSQLSVSFWVNQNDTTAFDYYLSIGDNGGSPTEFLELYSHPTASRSFNVEGSIATAGFQSFDFTSYVSNNTWFHIALVWDSTESVATDRIKVYIDGTLRASLSGVTSTFNTNGEIKIGRTWRNTSNTINGKLDEVAIFNTALTLSEVQALSTASAPANIMALDKKPVAYYPLGEQARVGGDANPNAGGSEWQFPNEVLQSQVFDFDGSTDYIDAGSSLGAIGTEVRTFSIWLKTSQTSGTQTVLGTRNYNNNGWVIQIELNLIMFYNVFTPSNRIQTTTNLTDGKWHHLVIVRAGSANNKIYVDGISQTLSEPQENKTDPQSSTNLLIGGSQLNYNRFFDGELSNVAIWNSDQSANIANIYNNGSPQSSYTVTPTAWYKLNATNTYAGLNPNYHSALDFISSENDYIDCGNNSSFDITSALTLSAWIKLSSSTTDQFYISKRSSSGDGYQISSFSNKAAGMSIWIGGSRKDLLGTTTHVQDVWYHVVGTYDGSNMRIYLNGVEENSVAQTGAIDTTTAKLILGAYDGVGYSLDGQLSNCAIYNQAISAEDILYLYNGGTPQTNISFEPTSWYKLDNLTTGIQDSGSASNNGTNSGATAVSSSVAVNQWNFNNVSQSQTPNWSSALDFDGSNDAIIITDSASVDNSLQSIGNANSYSFSFWINTTDSTSLGSPAWYSDVCILELRTQTGSGTKCPFNIGMNGGKLFFGRTPNHTTSDQFFESTTLINTGEWVHCGITINVNTLKFYINNSLDSTHTFTTATGDCSVGTTTSNIQIGARTTNSGALSAFLNGELNNIALLNTELSAAAISTLYNNGQPETAISSSPVSWWKLDNTTTGIQDSVGSNNGTNNGTTEIQTNVWTPRLNGESDTLPSTALVSSDLQFESPYSNFSLNFDGATNYIDTTLDIDANSNFSISFWFNWDQDQKVIITDGNFDAWSTIGYGFQIMSNGSVRFLVGDNGSSTGKTISSAAGSISANTWNHIVGVCDLSNEIRLYLNGTSVDNTTVGSSRNETTNNLRIGGDYSSSKRLVNGKIDETAVFNKKLNQAEVSQIYNNGYAADLTSLSPVSWWRLGEDAYFVSNNITIPNQISGAPNGTGAGTQTSILVADAPGSYASGAGTNLAVEDRKGDAPESTANSLSFNMIPTNRVSYPAGYTPTQVDNIYSMAFDGVNDYVEISSGTSFDFGSSEFSFSGWVKRSAIGDSTNAIFFIQKSGTTPTMQIRQNARNIKIDFNVGSTWSFLETTTNPIGNDTNWHHLAVTKSGTSMSVYFDGVLQNTGAVVATLDASNGTTFLGARGGTTQYWTGSMDEVAIFDYVLSERQIKQDIYDGTTTGKTADLNNISNLKAPVAWYRMGD